jgi:CRISPR-associated protein Csx16
MKTWFVSRHAGSVAWAQSQPLGITDWCAHLHLEQVHAGDVVIGSLPAHLAAEVCAKGARYLHLAMELAPEQRGLELSPDELQQAALRLVELRIEIVPPQPDFSQPHA